MKTKAWGWGTQLRGDVPAASGPWGEQEGQPEHRPSAARIGDLLLGPSFGVLVSRKRARAEAQPGCCGCGRGHCASEVHLAVAAEQLGFLPTMEIPPVPESGTRKHSKVGQEGRKDSLTDGRIRPGRSPTRGWAVSGGESHQGGHGQAQPLDRVQRI